MKKKELIIDIYKIVFWIIIITGIFLFGWRILGNSPSLDAMMLFITIFFLFLSMEGRRDIKYIKSSSDKQVNILQEIRDILKKKL